MSEEKVKLFQKLLDISNMMKDKMDVAEFKNYILGFLFYQFLSLKVEVCLKKQLKMNDLAFQEVDNDDFINEKLKEKIFDELGYFIKTDFLFSTISEMALKKENLLDTLKQALKNIDDSMIGRNVENSGDRIFEDIDLICKKIGNSEVEKNKCITEILLKLNDINFNVDKDNIDSLGNLYDFIIGEFANNAGKKTEMFYTPQPVSRLLASIVTLNNENIKTVYDPCCGSGSLLLQVKKQLEISKKESETTNNLMVTLSGQELTGATFTLARMNMLLHGIKYSEIDIVQGDSLEFPKHLDQKFDVVVSHPPFLAKWNADQSKFNDERFSEYGKLAPKTKADFAFVQHMIYHLAENGTMAVVLPHGVLFREAGELSIRRFLIEEKNYLDAVIGLPSNSIYESSIPTVILVFKKYRPNLDNVIFIDSSKEFEKRKSQHCLNDEHIEKILKTYEKRESIDKYSYVASLEEIKKNEYNLNIPRYVDTAEAEEEIDIDAVIKELEKIDLKIIEIDKKISEICKELAIKGP